MIFSVYNYMLSMNYNSELMEFETDIIHWLLSNDILNSLTTNISMDPVILPTVTLTGSISLAWVHDVQVNLGTIISM